MASFRRAPGRLLPRRCRASAVSWVPSELGGGEPLFRLRPASPPEGVRAQPIGGRRPRPGGHGRVIGDRLERLLPVGPGFDGGRLANRREPRRRGFERLPGNTGELAGIGGGGRGRRGPGRWGDRSAPACSPTGEGRTRLRPGLGAGRMDEGWRDRTAPCSRMLNDSRYGGLGFGRSGLFRICGWFSTADLPPQIARRGGAYWVRRGYMKQRLHVGGPPLVNGGNKTKANTELALAA